MAKKQQHKDGKGGQKKIKYGKKAPSVPTGAQDDASGQGADVALPRAPMYMYAFDRASAADLGTIDPHAPITLHVRTLSPLHLGSGYADIHVDADVVQDDAGLPYFPAKRLKGLLYESACEVAEMAEISGLPLFDREALDTLFQRGRTGEVQLVLHNLYMEHHAMIHADLKYLQEKYPTIFRAADVLGSYANLRWQTRINRETGVAETTSLHNMRVIDKGAEFSGEIRVLHAGMEHLSILALAVRNLSQCGGKRTRGFGRIVCTLRQNGRDIAVPLIENAIGWKTRKGGKR